MITIYLFTHLFFAPHTQEEEKIMCFMQSLFEEGESDEMEISSTRRVKVREKKEIKIEKI